MTNQTSNPGPEQLNDPEGQQLVQAIHDRKELTGTLANTICNASNYPKRAQPHLLGSDMSHVINKTADALLAAGYRKPRTITTAEELDALPVGTAIRDSLKRVLCRWNLAGWQFAGPTMKPEVVLPATVIYQEAAK